MAQDHWEDPINFYHNRFCPFKQQNAMALISMPIQTSLDLGYVDVSLPFHKIWRCGIMPWLFENPHSSFPFFYYMRFVISPGKSCSFVLNLLNRQIIISFILQLIILGYICLALRFLGSIIRIKRKNPENQMRMYLIQKAAEHRPVIRFVLVEFQEAQSFLMISIQIASIYVMSKKPELYGAVSFSQLMINISITKSICLEAIAFVTFGLWLVHKTDMKSWYILFCSTLTVILSIVTFHLSSHWKVIPANLSLPQENSLYECGHHPPPLIWCGNLTLEDRGNSFIIGFFATCIILFCYLFCHKLIVLLQVGSWSRQNPRDSNYQWCRTVYCYIDGLPHNSRWIKLSFDICVELTLITIIGFFTVKLISSVYDNLTDWNLGQVIAVTIWAPVIVKYLYWSLCKLI